MLTRPETSGYVKFCQPTNNINAEMCTTLIYTILIVIYRIEQLYDNSSNSKATNDQSNDQMIKSTETI